jgi:hypothetical protein
LRSFWGIVSTGDTVFDAAATGGLFFIAFEVLDLMS